MAVNIFNTKSNTLLSGTTGKDTISNGGYDENDTWHDGGKNVTINAGAGNDITPTTINPNTALKNFMFI